MGIRLTILLAGLAVLLVPATGMLDLPAARLGWRPEGGFAWQSESLAIVLHELVRPASLALGGALAVAAIAALVRRRPLAGRDARAWLFLLAALIVGPGLLVNAGLKDHWHRARPHQIAEFGGTARFTLPLVIADQCDRNCSFTAGAWRWGPIS
jgi:lipid A 4'-phosphatase